MDHHSRNTEIATQDVLGKLERLKDAWASLPAAAQAQLENSIDRALSGQPLPSMTGESYLRVFEHMPALIWRAGLDGLCDYFNQTWLDFTGRSLAEEVGNGWTEGVHPEDLQHCMDTYLTCFAAREAFEVEYRLRHRSGEYRWILDAGRPFYDEAGEFAGFIGTCFDLTERMEMERAISERESMFKGLFEYAPDAVIVADEEGKIHLANHQAELMFGYSREELEGQPIEILMPERYSQRHVGHVSLFMKSPRIRPMGEHMKLEGRRKDGGVFPVDITLGPVATPAGTIVLATIRDVTERKQMEAELAEVQRRLLDSAESERLHLAQELHDGPLQDLYLTSFQVNALKDVASSPDAGRTLAELNQTVLGVARSLRAMCGELRPPTLAPYGLERAIRSHVDGLREQYPGVEIALEMQPDRQMLSERVRLALFRIYQHAIANAVRHSGAQRIEVRLLLNAEQVKLEVQDNGKGFSMPRRAVDLLRKGHYGLAGSMERAESVGGQLEIESQPGAGTTIRVTLPRAEELQVGVKERLSGASA